ncbi:hypothetical protein JI723_13900 [Providencia manganoxydans]|uniref:Uncharacterized protein n=2 Tax=Providencia TaxID=586 RepID=A0AAI9DBN7_PROST|nr:hypothetical protein [Providencia stuartii]QQO61358.1 hypothetical protein JI723_13900 [Providencia manganoxydans]
MIILTDKPSIELTKWIDLKDGLRLQVGSINHDDYRSVNSAIHRHIDRLDAKMKVGTAEFDPEDMEISKAPDEMLTSIAARYLIRGWEGVGELNSKGEAVAVEYTPERGAMLLNQKPELYWQVLHAAALVGREESENVADTVKKH